MQKTIRLNGQKYEFDNTKALEWLKNKEKQKAEQKLLEEQEQVQNEIKIQKQSKPKKVVSKKTCISKSKAVKKPTTRKTSSYALKLKRGPKKAISQYDSHLNWIADFESIAEASQKLNIDRDLISKVLRHTKQHTFGFVFAYKGQEPKKPTKNNFYYRREDMDNFVKKMENQLEEKVNELSRISKINGFNEVMNIIRSDELALLKSLENKDKFVPLENAINGNAEVKAKVDYIEDLYARLKEQCKQ